jgi:glutamyl-tRNA synthetase/nondiscriminating glutamyl-tRNA synthetase
MRVRFAPSPTGLLHVGNARTALFNWLLARRHGGTFVLRIEDTDVQRSTTASELAILQDLRWLGLDWDEGPERGGLFGPYRQSERVPLYATHAKALLDRGLAYLCFCSQGQLEAERKAALDAGQPAIYSGRCRALDPDEARARVARGEPAAIRFHIPTDRTVSFDDLVRGPVTFHTEVIGDPIIVRADGRPAYNFAAVVDDALMKISDVVRGEDHISNTPRQLLFYEALGFPLPRFAHLAMVMGPDHSPLSKRHGATSVSEFREKGYLPESLVNYLALLGWSPGGNDEILPLEELARRFSIKDVGHSAGVFDEEKLAWINRHYLKVADPVRLAQLAWPYLYEAGFVRQPLPHELAIGFLSNIMPMASTSVDRLNQVPTRLRLVFSYDPHAALGRADIREELAAPEARAVIEALAGDLATAPRLVDRQTFRAAADRVKQKTGQKGRALYHPIRLALTSASEGPELDLLVPAIDRGADLDPSSGLAPIVGCRERADAFVEELSRTPLAGQADRRSTN